MKKENQAGNWLIAVHMRNGLQNNVYYFKNLNQMMNHTPVMQLILKTK